MAKCIQISSDVSKYDPLNYKISAENCKQLSNDIIDPLFLWYLWVGSGKAEPQWAKYPNPCVRRFARKLYGIGLALALRTCSQPAPAALARGRGEGDLPGARRGRLAMAIEMRRELHTSRKCMYYQIETTVQIIEYCVLANGKIS
jgi:hypothetical protein